MPYSATILIEDQESGDMYRYYGGKWIESCAPGVMSDWTEFLYVWDDEADHPMINMTIEDIAMAVLYFLNSEKSEEA